MPSADFSILTVGDISFMGRWGECPSDSPFEQVSSCFHKHDFVIANLESPLINTDSILLHNKCTLKGVPDWAQVLKRCGVGLVSLANNHLMDFGVEGLVSTISALDAVGVLHVGAGMNSAEARRPVLLNMSGQKVAVLGRSSVEVSSHCYAGPDRPGVAFLDPYELVGAIKACRPAVDHVLVLLHWGVEHYHYPSPSQRNLAQTLVDADADVLLGHHPHVLQGEERIGHAVVSYSSGNFLFDEFPWSLKSPDGGRRWFQSKLTDDNRQGLMLELKFSADRLSTKQIFTRISEDGRVEIDNSLGRKKGYELLCRRLHVPIYSVFWTIYALKREWNLRLRAHFIPRDIFKKLLKLRPRHFGELWCKLRRSVRIVAGKSSNPYEG